MNLQDSPLLQTIVDSAPIGICILSAEGFVAEMVNPQFLEIAGKPKASVLGKWYWEPFAEARADYEKALADVVITKKPYYADEVSLRLIRHGIEELIYVTFVYAPVFSDDGAVSKVAVWVLENTDQVREREKMAAASAAIKQERDRLYEFFRQASIGISVMVGEQLTVELVNSNYQEILPGRQLLGRPFFEALPEIKGTHIAEALMQVYHTGIPVEFRDQLVPISQHEHGATTDRYFNFSYLPRFDGEGKVDGIVNFAYEVTSFFQSKLMAQQATSNLEQILNMLPASVVVIKGDDLIVEMINESNLCYWKKNRDEVIGKPFLEILPDLADQPFAGQLRRVMQTGEVIDVKESPVLFTEADGTIRETFVDYTYQPLENLTGTWDGVLVMSFEITDRVQARRLLERYANELSGANDQLSVSNNKLAKSEARFKFLIQEAPVAIGVLHGREFIVETANQKVLDVWGKTSKIIGMPLSAALPELKGQPFLGLLDDVYTSGQAFYANEIRAMLEHGGELKEIFFNVVYQPVAGIDGAVADILVVAVDVTQQVNSRKKVEQAELTMRLAIEAGNVGTWSVDTDTFKQTTSLRLREMFGFNPDVEVSLEDIIGQVSPEYQPQLAAIFKDSAGTGDTYDISFTINRQDDGKLRWLRVLGSRNTVESATQFSFSGVILDITEGKRDEQRKGDFIGMVSHELKTPLTSLKGYLQLLHRKAEKGGDNFATNALENSVKQVRQMTTMINGFLNISRLESGKIHIERTSFELTALLRELEVEHKMLYASHELIFHPADEVWINADREKIAQVINNLVSNASKYSPGDTRIDVFCESAEEKVRISVRDQGIGIKQEDIERLFERYYRVENNGLVSGFGIGLYLSAEVIERHGGKIWAESEPGKGSTFFFELPV